VDTAQTTIQNLGPLPGHVDLLGVLLRRKLLIAAVTLAGLTAALFYSVALATPSYRSTAAVLVRPITSAVAPQGVDQLVVMGTEREAAVTGDVAALAKMALASMYRGTNRAPEAIAIYKDLSEHPTVTVSKSQAQLELAEMYESTDPQQATLIYQQLQKDDPRSPAAQLAGHASS